MNIIITGGLGLIGYNLSIKLSKLYPTSEIFIIDDCSTQNNTKICKYLQKSLPTNVKILIVNHKNLGQFSYIKILEYLKTIQFDFAFYLASPASPKFFNNEPITTFEKITIDLYQFLNLLKNNIGTLFFASTSEVYGNIKFEYDLPLKEDNINLKLNSQNKRNSYALSKLMCENLIYNFAKEYKFNYKIGRIFNTYGYPLFDDGRLIQNLFKSSKYNNTFIINKNNIKRSFCHIDDLINQIIKFVNSSYNGILNLGNDKDYYTIEEVLMIFQKVIKKKINYEYNSNYKDKEDPQYRLPDLTLNRKILNYECVNPLLYGLKQIYENQDLIFI